MTMMTEISNMQYFSAGSYTQFYSSAAGTFHRWQLNDVTVSSW